MVEALLRRPTVSEILLTLPREPLGTVITIGGSRGIGAAENVWFAELLGPNVDIVTVHQDPKKEKRQQPILDEIRAAGVRVESVVGDITEDAVQEEVLEKALGLGPISVVNINAAGGALGEDAEGVARRLNVEMPRRVVERVLPHMKEGGVILYPSSLWSTYYGSIRMLPNYQLVAATKHEAEEYLTSQIDRFGEHKVSLRFVCGHAVRGTFIIDALFGRRFPEAMAAVEATAFGGKFPTTADMAKAAVYSVLNPDLPSGARIYVLGEGEWGYVSDKQALQEYIERINRALEPFGFEK